MRAYPPGPPRVHGELRVTNCGTGHAPRADNLGRTPPIPVPRCREVALGRDGQVIVAVPIVQHREETVAAVVSRSQRRLDRSPDCCAVSGSASASSRPFCWESQATSGPGKSRRLLRMMPTVGPTRTTEGRARHPSTDALGLHGRAAAHPAGGSTGRVKPSTGQTGQQYSRQDVVASTPRW